MAEVQHRPQERRTCGCCFFIFFPERTLPLKCVPLCCLGGNTKSNIAPPAQCLDFFLHHQNPITTDEFGIDGKSLGPGIYSSDVAP